MKNTMLALSLVTVAACGSKKGDEPSKKDTKEPVAKTVEKVAPPKPVEPPPIVVNPEVKQLIADVVANCKIDADNASASECKNGESEKFGPYVQEKQPTDFYVSVAEIALTDGVKDKNVFAAALIAIGNVGWSSGKEWLAKNATPAAADRFLKLDALVTDAQGFSFYGMGAAIPLLAGRAEELTAVLAARPTGTVKTGIINYYVTYGGAAVLPTLAKIAKEDKDADVRSAAVWAAGVALSNPWSSAQASFALPETDRPAVCDYAKEFLTDAEPQVANSAASSMGRCKGAYIDAALAVLETRATTEKFSDGLAGAFKDQCWAESSIEAVNGTPEQCMKAVAALEKVTARTDLEPGQLRMALWSLTAVTKYGCGAGYGSGPAQSPECVAHVKEVIGKFASSSEQQIVDEVKRDLEDL